MTNFDRSFSLEKLEGVYWGDANFESNLVTQCHELRKIPLQQLTIENLRILIGQKIGIKYLIPIAIDYLEENAWHSGNFYCGDLLENVLKIEISFWNSHPDLFYRLSEIMTEVQSQMELFCNIILPLWNNTSKNFEHTE